MREVVRDLLHRRRYQWDVECNSPFFFFFFFFFQIISQNIYIAHETQKMQSLFTFLFIYFFFFLSSNT